MELAARRPGEPLRREVVELSRLLQAEEAGFVAGGPPPGPQEMVDGIPDPAGLLDPRGRLAVVNRALDALVGTGRALGRTLLEITRSAELGDAAEQAIAGTSARGEFNVVSLDKLLFVTLSPLADRRALEQILMNLLDNAVKFTPEGGRVTVLADGTGPAVVLSVLDTGPGIEPRHRPRLFERFYRADTGRARESGGTGLGLAIVKHLAQAQRGEVGVESGQGGSRFWVKL